MYIKNVKMVVLCWNANGSPDVHKCSPEVTQEQLESGEHYKLAIENAERNNYKGPMFVFDEHDDAATRMGDVINWLASRSTASQKLYGYEALKQSAQFLGITDDPQGSQRGELAEKVLAALKAFEADQPTEPQQDVQPSP